MVADCQIKVIKCNRCRKEVRLYALENIEHKYQEPNICKCEDNVIHIRTVMCHVQMKTARGECGVCTHKAFAVIPEIAAKISMVQLYCEFCKTQQYHNVTDRPNSLLDIILDMMK